MKKNVLNPITGKFDLINNQNIEEVLQQPTNEPDGIYVISITGGVASLAPATGQAVGTIQQYASITGIPTNELILTGDLVNKQEVDKTTYAALYAVIGDVYGVPLDPANFVLPPIVGLLPKGGTSLDYMNNGGSNFLTEGQLPTITPVLNVSTNTGGHSIIAVGDNLVSTSSGNNGTANIYNNDTTNTISLQGFNSFGSNQPHEHPYQNFIYTICFESVAYGGVSPTPSLQQVSDVGFNSTNRLQFNTINYALVTDIVPITPEDIQDAAFAILTDTPTINLTYNDVTNQVTADVIDNSITNIKLAKMPPYTVIGNELTTTEDAQYLQLAPTKRGKLYLIAGQRTVTDSRITTTSFAYALSTSNGNITSVPIRANIQNGYVTFSTGQLTDTAEFSYEIQF